MPDDPTSLDDLARRLRAAMDATDVEAIGKLLDPAVRWGPPDDPAFGCHNRSEVLAWWQRSADQGMRARVTEVVVGADKLLIGFKVRNPSRTRSRRRSRPVAGGGSPRREGHRHPGLRRPSSGGCACWDQLIRLQYSGVGDHRRACD